MEWRTLNQGGEIATPTSADEYQKQLDIADRLIVPDLHEKCVKAGGSIIIWMGYNDMELEGEYSSHHVLSQSNTESLDEWRNPYSQDPITWEGAWKPGQPNGGSLENCIRTEDRLWADRSCAERYCALCYFPTQMNLTMRGLCKSETNQMEGYFDTIYFIRDFTNGKPEWRGLGKSHIYYESMEQIWKIESLYDKNRYAYFQPQDSNPYLFYPTGRGNWKVNSGICRLTNSEPRRLSLTNWYLMMKYCQYLSILFH